MEAAPCLPQDHGPPVPPHPPGWRPAAAPCPLLTTHAAAWPAPPTGGWGAAGMPPHRVLVGFICVSLHFASGLSGNQVGSEARMATCLRAALKKCHTRRRRCRYRWKRGGRRAIAARTRAAASSCHCGLPRNSTKQAGRLSAVPAGGRSGCAGKCALGRAIEHCELVRNKLNKPPRRRSMQALAKLPSRLQPFTAAARAPRATRR